MHNKCGTLKEIICYVFEEEQNWQIDSIDKVTLRRTRK